jgi:hypothetical protein
MQLDLTKEELAAATMLINKGIEASMPPLWLTTLQKISKAAQEPETPAETPPE